MIFLLVNCLLTLSRFHLHWPTGFSTFTFLLTYCLLIKAELYTTLTICLVVVLTYWPSFQPHSVSLHVHLFILSINLSSVPSILTFVPGASVNTELIKKGGLQW